MTVERQAQDDYEWDDVGLRNSPLLRAQVKLTPTPSPPPVGPLQASIDSSLGSADCRGHRRLKASHEDAVLISFMDGGERPAIARQAGTQLMASDVEEEESVKGTEVNMWQDGDQLRISLSPTLLTGLKASSPDPLSRAQSEIDPKHPATPINDEHCHNSRTSQSPSSASSPPGPARSNNPDMEEQGGKRGHQDVHEEFSSGTYHCKTTKATRSAYRNSNHLPQAHSRALLRTAWPSCGAVGGTPEIDDMQPQVDHAPINPAVLDISHNAATHSTIHQVVKPKNSKVPWTEEEDAKLLRMWNEDRSWDYIAAASLVGLKGLSGCAVRQNSQPDPVLGPVVLESEEQPIASLALGLLIGAGRTVKQLQYVRAKNMVRPRVE